MFTNAFKSLVICTLLAIISMGNAFQDFQPNFESGVPTSASSSANAASSQSSASSTSLETFVSSFTRAIDSSAVLSDAFDISQASAKDFSDFVHQVLHTRSMSVGVSDPNALATAATQHITNNFQDLSYPILVSINANAMGKYLLAEGILNDMNAASLASAFANEMETSAKQTVDKNMQESKFRALVDGYANFLKFCEVFTPEKLPVAAKYFGDEVRLAGVQSD